MSVILVSLWFLFGLIAAVHLFRTWDLSAAELVALSVGLGIVGLVAATLLRLAPPMLALAALVPVLVAIPIVLYRFYQDLAPRFAERRKRRRKGADAPRRRAFGRPGPILVGTLMVAVVAALFRFVYVGYSEFQGDEARAMLMAQALVERRDAGILLLHKKGPIEILLPSAVVQLGDLREAAARYVFAVAGLAAVLAILGFGRRLWSPRAGWLAAVVLAIDGYMIAFSRIVQYQAVVALFSILAVWCAWRFYHRESVGDGYLALAALLLGLGTWAHYEMVLAALPVGWLVVARAREDRWGAREAARRLAAPVLLGAAVTAAFYVPFVRHPQFASTASYIGDKRLGGQLLYNQLADYFARASFYNASYYVMLIVATLSLAIAWQLARAMGSGAAGRQRSLLADGDGGGEDGHARSGASGFTSPGEPDGARAGTLGAVVAVLWLAVVALLVARPAWFEAGGRSLALFVFLVPLVVLLASRRLPVEWRAVLLWFAAPFVVAAFLTQKPHTHFYTMMPAAALLCGWAWDRALVWLEDGRRVGRAHARAGAAIVGTAVFAVFALHQFVVFVRHDPEYKRVYPAARLPGYWVPFGDTPPRGGYFGFPYRAGWNALRWLEHGSLEGDYDSNEEILITGWYTGGAVRCAAEPGRYLVAWRPQDAVEIPQDEVERQYGLAKTVCVECEPKLDVYASAPVKEPATLCDWDCCPDPIVTPCGEHCMCGSERAAGRARDLRTILAPGLIERPLAVSQSLRLPLPQTEITATLGGTIHLLGADFPGATSIDGTSGIPRVTVNLDGSVGAVLLWSADVAPEANYSVFVHLRDADGETVLQHDGWPECGVAPTSRWAPGQIVYDGHSLGSPRDLPVGRYELVAGLYDVATGERLPATASRQGETAVTRDGALVLAHVSVAWP